MDDKKTHCVPNHKHACKSDENSPYVSNKLHVQRDTSLLNRCQTILDYLSTCKTFREFFIRNSPDLCDLLRDLSNEDLSKLQF